MKKILIIGISGAGKTTFSLKLQKKLNLPLIHLDQQFWRPNWEMTPKPEWRRKVAEMVKADTWIMDGNYSSTLDIRIPAADTIFILEFSRYLAIYRALTRSLKSYKKTRPDMGQDCPERIDFDFLKYIWNFNKVHRQRTEAIINEGQYSAKVIRFKTSKDAEDYLKKL